MKRKFLIYLSSILLIIMIAIILQSKNKGKYGSDVKVSKLVKRDYWPTHDWKSATPKSKGMDAKQLSTMDEYVKKSLPQIRSILIVKDGYLVCEKYFRNHNINDLFLIASVTKTFTSTLIGIAINKGYLKSVNQKVYPFFPEYINKKTNTAIKKITIKHLLTMCSGFQCNEYGLFSSEVQKNMINYVFTHKMQGKPGVGFSYNTLNSQVLSGIITKASKMTALEFADKYLFKSLGIKQRKWDFDAQGNNTGGLGLYMRSRDLAKFGYLLLNKGLWEGKQVIPSKWIETITTKHNNGGMPERDSYGMHCWITTIKNHPAFYASGFGGQYIYMIPDLDIVIVITSNLDGPHMENKILVENFIIPSIKK